MNFNTHFYAHAEYIVVFAFCPLEASLLTIIIIWYRQQLTAVSLRNKNEDYFLLILLRLTLNMMPCRELIFLADIIKIFLHLDGIFLDMFCTCIGQKQLDSDSHWPVFYFYYALCCVFWSSVNIAFFL